MKKHLTFFKFLILILLPALCHGQAVALKGKVTEANGTPLYGVNILIKGTNKGTISNEKGEYAINANKGNIITFSYIGFIAKEITVGNSDVVDLSLAADANSLNEVVITALGVKREAKTIGYAIQQIKGEDIIKSTPIDLAQGLMGKVAGLQINTSNGLDNASSRIVIRGNNSLFGNNQPLIVIDGAILDNKSLSQSNTENSLGGYQDWGNYLSYMNMDNVQDISVLKGPNAAALYGARGANGVILITSKKGTVKKGIGLDYTMSNTFTNAFRFTEVQNEYGGGFAAALWTADPKLPKTATGENYVPTLYPSSWVGNALATNGTGVESSHGPIPGGLNTWDQFSWYGAGSSWGPRLDGTMARWWNGELRPYSPQPNNREYLFRQGSQNTHNLAFSAANDFGSIRLSSSLTNMISPLPNVDSKNINFSLGSNIRISKSLSAEVSAAFNNINRLNTPEIGTNNSWTKFMIYGMSREYQPLERDIYANADGSKNNFPGSYPHAEYSKDLFWAVYERNERLKRDEFLSTIKLNAEITPWLNGFVRTSLNFIGTNFEKKFTTTNPDKINGGAFVKTVSKDNVINNDIMLTAHKENLFGKKFNASASAMFNTYSNGSVGITGSNHGTFAVPNVYSLSNYIDINRTSMNERRYDVRSQALLGILNLSYNDYLFLDVTGRNDINSTLPKNNNSYFYPSANVAFVFTEALGMDNSKNGLSYGKVRLAYGKSANATEPYQLDATYNVGNFGGQATNSFPNTIPPYNLRFQTSESFEAGLSLGFLKDRINVDLTYYDILAENQILQAALPASSGATLVTFNSGKLKNNGIEAIINANLIRSSKLTWNSTLNFAKNVNKIVELADGVKEQWLGDVFGTLGVVMKVAPGQKYGAIYGTDFLLDAQGRKQVKNILDPTTKAVIGTEYLISNEQVEIGNAMPKFTGGWNNSLKYQRFMLNFLVDFKVGGDIYSVDHATATGSGLTLETLKERNGGGLPYTYPDGTKANHGVILEGYNVSDEKENARVVHYLYKYGNMYAGWSHLNRPRSLSVFENTWAKMREVSLTYDLPDLLASKTKVFQGLSLTLTGRNLFYIYSSLPDQLNPEAINGTGNAQGLQWSAFPSFRSLGFTIRARF